jgi:hypothetical protein
MVTRLTQSAWLLTPKRAFSPAAAWKSLSFSFDFAASPQNQTNLNGFSALPKAKKAVAVATA